MGSPRLARACVCHWFLGLATLLASPALSQDVAAEGWRILALRVDFPREDPDEITTSGTGGFDLRPLAEALPDYLLPFDSPPHDRTHYEQHLEALSRYYAEVSAGRVLIDGEVYPRADAGAYTLPQVALLYGNGRTPEEISRQWRELIVDAVALAAIDPDGPDFASFDSYLIIHAGLGHETGQLNDVRSVFLGVADLAATGGPIEIDGHTISEAWILPEAVDDRGRAGLNGLMAKFFGHQLGLPGLSNFARGLPAVGGWSLMDVGANRLGFVRHGDELEFVFGVVPPHLLAWSKARLGWIEPLEVRRDTTVQIVAGDRSPSSVALAPAVRIPLTPTEYLLLENRQQRGRTEHDLPAAVDLPFPDLELTWIDPQEAELSHTITAAESDSLAGRGAGVWLGADEYDVFVPGSGILIWHVDETAMATAAEGFNNDRERPGLALIEADGARDIGNAFFDRQDLTEGTRADPFFAGEGEGGLAGVSRLGVDTTPATATHTGLTSGVDVEVLSGLGDTMSVRIRFRRSATGWPQSISGTLRLQADDVDGDGVHELLAAAHDLHVLGAGGAALDVQGDLLASADGWIYTATADGLVSGRQGADSPPVWEVPLGDALGPALVSADLDGHGAALVIGGQSLAVLDPQTGSSRFTDLGDASGLVAADLDGDGDDDLVAVGADGRLRRLQGSTPTELVSDLTGSLLAPAAADLDGDGRADLVLVSTNGGVSTDGQSQGDISVSLVGPVSTPPSLADVDGDGSPELLLVTEAGVHVITAGGLPAAGFPAAPPRHQESGGLRGEVVAADLDGDGAQELFVSSRVGVYGFEGDGSLLSGFPVAAPGAPTTSPVLADVDGDGSVDLAVADGDGVNLWRPVSWDGGFAAGHAIGWTQAGGSASSRRSLRTLEPTQPGPQTKRLLSSAYCYPNPAGGGGPARLRFFVGREARVSMTVYDAIGEVVERLEADDVRPSEPNEIAWSVSDYASGLYLLRLSARGLDGDREEVTVRMAVVN